MRSAIHRGSISSKHDAVSSKNLPSACLRVMRVAEPGRMLFGVVCTVVRMQRVGRGGRGLFCVLRVEYRSSEGGTLISSPTNVKRMCELAGSRSISIPECRLIGQRA